jgi:hypothetical protein
MLTVAMKVSKVVAEMVAFKAKRWVVWMDVSTAVYLAAL